MADFGLKNYFQRLREAGFVQAAARRSEETVCRNCGP
jgi:hypothetical protein